MAFNGNAGGIGINNIKVSVLIEGSKFDTNKALGTLESKGGAGSITSFTKLDINNSQFSENYAVSEGGAFFVF